MNKITKFFINILALAVLITPFISIAYTLGDPLVPECPSTGCAWKELMVLVDNIITFIIKYMAIPIAAIMFAYAGFELVSSGGSTEKRGVAKSVFTNAVIGLIIVVAAWLIIKTILSILGYKGAWIGF
jgi:hypothetical protein